MKPFDIELARQGHPVCTRDGRPVKILDFDFNYNAYPIIAKVCNKGFDTLQTYTKEGFLNNSIDTSDYDLCMASVKKEGWINIYPCIPDMRVKRNTGLSIYETKEEAIQRGRADCLATIKIEWEE